MAMPQTVYYSAPEVKIGAASGSSVDLSEFAKSAVLTRQADALESSSMASRDRFYQAGMNSNLVFDMTFTVRIIGIGPADYKCLSKLLELADKVRQAQIGLTDVRPAVTTIGSQDYASYELTIGAKIGP